MRFQAGIQILLLIVAVIIVMTVVKPKFAEIQYNQDEVVGYKSALQQASVYNTRFAELINKSRAIPVADRQALNTYMPLVINPTRVSRDIENIVQGNDLLLVELAADESGDVTVTNPDDFEGRSSFVRVDPETTVTASGLIAQRFTVNTIGTYSQLKDMLEDFEKNAYPLRLIKLDFKVEELAVSNEYSVVLETYALKGMTQ